MDTPMICFIVILIILLVLFLLYLFMVFPNRPRKEKWKPFLGYHYAHRGLFNNEGEAPENSLLAFAKAVENGYGIELDVQLTKDNKLVVFHDDSLKRMCGVDGMVWEYTLEELQTFHLASSKQCIPTFEDVLQTVGGKVPLIIEYKLDRVQTRVCELANEVLKDYKGVYCIECFHPLAPHWYKKNRPDVVRGQLCEEYFRTPKYRNALYFAMAYLAGNFFSRPDFIAYNCLHRKNLGRRFCRKLGALSVAWTVKSVEQFEEIKDDFDLFIFDSCILDPATAKKTV